ncbi:TPA: YkgJ family cysteine cluster protein [Pseudomonas aeruginosa]|uniref:YkgJ family cysteine cluster protein n=1 Tax=Pseudomonas aeruginosa TaxID=287 RepID=UPI0003B9E628|nr:hypothetical protein [Pseudomonas aeruginosa]AXL68558.1 hypothetical protein Y31_0590 [Pseudomonas aeruginosa]EIU5458478.1 hypothetical protein [Pseudomonas aeruginosa]EIU5539795.1 hypothetical protein [Pseudomonas aeruginosa]EKW4491129.1 hypothetical protein [Pseudomonas aeruginosa]EKY0073195.1 hypothetical protein [Pseudomonas aeruginosa]
MSDLEQIAAIVAQRAYKSAAKSTRQGSPERARRESCKELSDVLIRAGELDRRSIDCGNGCSYCCYIRVIATPVEIFGLIDHLQACLSTEEFNNFKNRVDAAAAAIKPLTANEHLRTNVQCPALQDGRCIAYAARPMRCRAHHSVSTEFCKDEYDNPNATIGPQTALPFRKTLGMAHMEGFETGLSHVGFDGDCYELIAALHEALNEPSARAEFLARRKAFRSVSREQRY